MRQSQEEDTPLQENNRSDNGNRQSFPIKRAQMLIVCVIWKS